jgi:hypothetical protein
MNLATRKSDVKNHMSRNTKKKVIALQSTNLSDGTNTGLNAPPLAEEKSITRAEAGYGQYENIETPWTDAEMKVFSP